LCLLLTPLCRYVYVGLGIMDQPDNNRKIHTRPIARVGGLAIALSYVGALVILLRWAPQALTISVQHQHLMLTLAPAVTVVFLTGLMDDFWTLRPWQKLLGQSVGAALAVTGGVRIGFFGDHPSITFLAIPLTVLWLLVCSNAFNLIDGMDGLAAGVGLFASVTTLLAAALQGNWGLATATVPLVGCLLGFLFYNFNPASVFLGDCGSLSVGFLLGCFGVIWSQKSATLLGLLAPMMALALPLMDTCISIGRRFLRNKPVFSPDRGHIHHRLLAQGLHPRAAALVLYGVCAVGAVLSLLQSSLAAHLGGLCIVSFCALTWFGVKKLRYVEFHAASHVLRSGGILHLVQHEIYVQGLRERLAVATTPRECWRVILGACQDLQFATVNLSFEQLHFEEVLDSEGLQPAWEFSLFLGDRGQLRLTRRIEKGNPAHLLSILAVLQECLETKQYPVPRIEEQDAMISRLVGFEHLPAESAPDYRVQPAAQSPAAHLPVRR
jgi:UDP-GlcNAc:undecaprenyl-phosphate GlcNAc-1-phosphate transferase